MPMALKLVYIHIITVNILYINNTTNKNRTCGNKIQRVQV